MRLSKAFQDALQYYGAVKGFSRATLANYERTGHQFIAYLRARDLDDSVKHFTSDVVMDWCLAMGALQPPAKANTVLNKINGLSTMARHMLKRKDGKGRPLLAANPTTGFDRPSQVQVETKFLYPDELQRFLRAECPVWVSIARELFLDTGIRVAEACEANVGDVQKVEGVVYLTLAVKGRRHAGQEPASIPLSATCAESIEQSLLRRGVPMGEDPLLVDGLGQRWRPTQLGMAMHRLGLAAGIRRLSTSPHKLRHTANVIARQAGVDALTRAKMLNHRSMKTLARYDHLVPGETAKGREQQRLGMDAYLRHGNVSQPPEGV